MQNQDLRASFLNKTEKKAHIVRLNLRNGTIFNTAIFPYFYISILHET